MCMVLRVKTKNLFYSLKAFHGVSLPVSPVSSLITPVLMSFSSTQLHSVLTILSAPNPLPGTLPLPPFIIYFLLFIY